VLWTGDIVPCCQDFDGMNVLGSVLRNDDVVHMPYYEMCLTCGGMQFADDGLWSCDVPELCHKEGGCGYDIHICDN
jgi:hypothetical protein